MINYMKKSPRSSCRYLGIHIPSESDIRYLVPGLRLIIIIIIIHSILPTHPFYLSNLIEPKPLRGKRESR